MFNFAAEKVQRVICEWTFIAEQQEYVLEGVEWTNLEYADNSQVVGILERGSYGVLSILEEVCMSSPNIVQQHSSSSAANSAREDGGSGTSTPSLVTVSPDDIFLERLSERFGNHPSVEVRPPNGYSTNTTALSASSGGESSNPEASHSKADEAAKKKPPPHCFR